MSLENYFDSCLLTPQMLTIYFSHRLLEIMGLTVQEISQDAYARFCNKNRLANQMIEQATELGYLPFHSNKPPDSDTSDPYASLNPLGNFIDSTSAITSTITVEVIPIHIITRSSLLN